METQAKQDHEHISYNDIRRKSIPYCNANSYKAIGFFSSNISKNDLIFDAERMRDFGGRINGLLVLSSSLGLTCALLNAEG